MKLKQRDELVQKQMDLMTKDAKSLHNMVKHRSELLKANDERLQQENEQIAANLRKIQSEESKKRHSKLEAKEHERQKLSRTMMANLVTAADYPDAPTFVPHMINVLKNILGT